MRLRCCLKILRKLCLLCWPDEEKVNCQKMGYILTLNGAKDGTQATTCPCLGCGLPCHRTSWLAFPNVLPSQRLKSVAQLPAAACCQLLMLAATSCYMLHLLLRFGRFPFVPCSQNWPGVETRAPFHVITSSSQATVSRPHIYMQHKPQSTSWELNNTFTFKNWIFWNPKAKVGKINKNIITDGDKGKQILISIEEWVWEIVSGIGYKKMRIYIFIFVNNIWLYINMKLAEEKGSKW